MGWVRVGAVTARKTFKKGHSQTHEYRDLTPFEDKYGGLIVGIFIGGFVILALLALIFG